MADTPKRLVGPVALSASATTLYTAPRGTTTALRDIHIANESSSPAVFTLSIGTDGAGKRLYKDVSVPGNTTIRRTGNVILHASDVLQGYGGTSLTITISGLEMT